MRLTLSEVLKEQDCNAEVCGSVSCCGPTAYERGRASRDAEVAELRETIKRLEVICENAQVERDDLRKGFAR
jgi:hypothetical protein